MHIQNLHSFDPEVFEAIAHEDVRQHQHIELIASENFVSPAVLEAVGSILTNKYAEGYPGKRYYGGCQYVDAVESLAIDRAKQLFGAEHVNVQPHSGSQANMAVYLATIHPGDKILTLSLENGGHLTHGHPKNISGMLYNVLHYTISSDTGQIDYDEMEKIAQQEHPKLITIGASAYPRNIDFKRTAEIGHAVGAIVMADIAHIAGLVAAGLHQSPVPYCDIVTTTTHKTLRGPRGGIIMCKEKYAKAIDSAVFPGIQGGPLMHVIAGKAVCFLEALQPEFKTYQQHIIRNAQALARALSDRGFHLATGGSDNHLMLLDLRKNYPDLTGKDAQAILESINITTNKNTVPNETRSPFITSGLRLGTPAVTSRGMREHEMVTIADFIHQALSAPNDSKHLASLQSSVREFCSQFPIRA